MKKKQVKRRRGEATANSQPSRKRVRLNDGEGLGATTLPSKNTMNKRKITGDKSTKTAKRQRRIGGEEKKPEGETLIVGETLSGPGGVRGGADDQGGPLSEDLEDETLQEPESDLLDGGGEKEGDPLSESNQIEEENVPISQQEERLDTERNWLEEVQVEEITPSGQAEKMFSELEAEDYDHEQELLTYYKNDERFI